MNGDTFELHGLCSQIIMLGSHISVCFAVLFSEREQNSVKDFSTNNCSKILSLCVSYITPVYVMKLKDFFPNKELREAPYFDGRVVCYPNMKTIRDYLAWRQVDCKLLEPKSTFL